MAWIMGRAMCEWIADPTPARVPVKRTSQARRAHGVAKPRSARYSTRRARSQPRSISGNTSRGYRTPEGFAWVISSVLMPMPARLTLRAALAAGAIPQRLAGGLLEGCDFVFAGAYPHYRWLAHRGQLRFSPQGRVVGRSIPTAARRLATAPGRTSRNCRCPAPSTNVNKPGCGLVRGSAVAQPSVGNELSVAIELLGSECQGTLGANMLSPDERVAGQPVNISSITNEPKFASEVLLAEYKTLRDEILKKMDHRTSMVVCSVTVSSAVLGFGIERQSGPLLLVSPLVSLLLGILILFHNIQIGEVSEHLRSHVEKPISGHFGGYKGWHELKGDPKDRLRQRMLPYHLPLVLIAITPAVVAIPLALSSIGSIGLTIPVLIVDASLLVLYVVQLMKHRDSI